jgi:hypothetical protein
LSKANYDIVLHHDTMLRISAYCEDLRTKGTDIAGVRMQRELQNVDLLDPLALLACLLNSKQPMIFAESQVIGDGSDWTLRELSLLGDIGISARVSVFDDGRHSDPDVHNVPLEGLLLFVPGPLLRNDQGEIAADWLAVTGNGQIDQVLYDRLIERRMLPLLLHADSVAGAVSKKAFVTVPGIGCGQFSGEFRGQMGEYLKRSLVTLLQKNANHLPNIEALYYDAFSECQNERYRFGSLSLMVRPLLHGNHGKPQLCSPSVYEEEGDNFGDCMLASFVAWDHVSWPGNDFYGSSRATDDGVKAAATSSMFAMTGVEGQYDRHTHRYMPPVGIGSWDQVVRERNLRFAIDGRLHVLGG